MTHTNPMMDFLNNNREQDTRQVNNQWNDLLQRGKAMLNGRNPQTMYNELMRNNPNFANFARQCEGKTPQEVMRQFGLIR